MEEIFHQKAYHNALPSEDVLKKWMTTMPFLNVDARSGNNTMHVVAKSKNGMAYETMVILFTDVS